MKIKLVMSKREAEVLHRALDIYTNDVRQEISRTDEPKFKAGLQEELACLKSLEDRLIGYLYRTPSGETEEKAA